VLVGISVHPLWLGLIFSWLFGLELGWLPVSGYCDLVDPTGLCRGPADWLTHMLLPWTTFALVFAALYVRTIRATVTEALHEDWVRQARAKGLSEWGTVRTHVLPKYALLDPRVELETGFAAA
jgi:peptide/nickel transport system permease protein